MENVTATRLRLKRIAFLLVTAILTVVSATILMATMSPTGNRVHMYTPPLEVHEERYEIAGATAAIRIAPEPITVAEESPDEADTQIDAPIYEPEYSEESYTDIPIDASDDSLYDASYFETAGVLYDNGVKYTWYSQNVLPGGGLDIPGRHTDMGFVMDGDNRIVVASTDYPAGTEIDMPFGYGKGIVLDTGYLEPGQIDVYTDF